MVSEVEDRIHRALTKHPLERIEHGYRLEHPNGAGVSTLRLLPADSVHDQMHLAATAEIVAEHGAAGLPAFHAAGLQRLNALSVYGCYQFRDGRLRQTAKYSIYANEAAPHLAAQTILNAFGGQLPLGRSTALATASAAALAEQQSHHRMPQQWPKPVEEKNLAAATAILQQRGLAAANNAVAVWAELPLSGECPSRSIDPRAETAILQVNVASAHPVAGAGYLATITLPPVAATADAASLCARLNELEMQEIEFAPRLGAWGLHAAEDLPGYSCFIPTAERSGALHLTLMWWGVRRAAWLRDHFWLANVGFKRDFL